MDRGAWQATVQMVAKSQTRLSDYAHTHTLCSSLFNFLLLFSRSITSDSLQPHELQHPSFPCPSLSPRICEGRTHVILVRDGLFCCCLVISHIQLFCDPMDCSLPGSSVHGISQSGILEWVAISFSWGSSWPRDQTHLSCTAGRFFTTKSLGKSRGLFRKL